MKRKNFLLSAKFSLALMLLFSAFFKADAQSCSNPPSCILNPTMVASAGGNLNPGSTTMSDWYYSHGTPTVGIGSGASGSNSIWMWSYESKGEGVYACYNFQQDRPYRICFWVKNTGTLNVGNLIVKAANGLTQPTYSASTAIPTPSSSQVIDNTWGYNTTWTQVVLDYTPNANYNQLWFYPFWSGISAEWGYRQYEVMISDVYVFEEPLGVGYAIPCGGDIVLNAHQAPCVTTNWYGPSGAFLGTGDVVIHNADPSMNGDYTMKMTVGDCEYELVYQVMVENCNCEDFEASFEAEGESPVNFFETSTGPGTSVSWYWDFGDGTSSTQQNPNHQYAKDGEYEVCLTVIRRVGNQTCCKRICRWIFARGDGSVGQGGGNPSGLKGFTNESLSAIARGKQFTDLTGVKQPVKEYLWNFGDGTTSGQQNPAHVYAKPGIYTVCLKVRSYAYNDEGVVIEENEKEYCNEVVVDNSGQFRGEINIMPNPANNQAIVNVKNMSNPKVVLRTINGVEVATGELAEKNNYVLQLQKLAPGVYVVEVQSENGVRTAKLVKE